MSSRDFSHLPPGEFSSFSQSFEIGHWCESIPLEDFPPTPPDTASECANSDCPEMNPSWVSPLPENQWIMNPASEQDVRQPLTAQELSALDTSSWFSTADGSVDRGLSPVLSYESQSAHSLNSMPELDISVLPPSLDLSFVSEPYWTGGYPEEAAIYYPVHANGYAPARSVMTSHPLPENNMCSTVPQSVSPGVHQPVFNPHAVQPAHLGGNLPNGSVATVPASHRALLPRTQMPEAVTSQQGRGAQCMTERQIPYAQAIQPTVATVSSVPVQPKGMPAARPISPHGRVPSPYTPLDQIHGANQSYTSRQAFVMPGQSTGTNIYPDPSMDDLGAFFHFDGTDHVLSPRVTSHVMARSTSAKASTTPSAQDQDAKSNAATGETEEGRHRSHPLYSLGPEQDGMYHCPYENESNCQHRPTKLKCNYDKFIDSHIKPFRCKLEVCSKQEFSSTACLLRHEREAHGMHGHGDRPHLCWYEGCERSVPGSGFPRRYNLFDHMKRVHDHKENVSEQANSPVGAETNKKVSSRKRKAVSPHDVQPAARRVKSAVVPQQQAMAIPPAAYHSVPLQSMPVHPTRSVSDSQLQQERQHAEDLRMQWVQRRDLLAKEMDHANGPADIARLSQDFRRLSEEYAPS